LLPPNLISMAQISIRDLNNLDAPIIVINTAKQNSVAWVMEQVLLAIGVLHRFWTHLTRLCQTSCRSGIHRIPQPHLNVWSLLGGCCYRAKSFTRLSKL